MSLHHDLLAELELTMVPSSRTWPTPARYPTAGQMAEVATLCGSCRRTFWCALKEEEVEVEFETKRFLGFPRPVSVNRCSAFDEPEQVACTRHCLDSRFRRQWPFALPISDHRRPPEG